MTTEHSRQGAFSGQSDSDWNRSASAIVGETNIKVLIESFEDTALWQSLTQAAMDKAGKNVTFEISPVRDVRGNDGKGEVLNYRDESGAHLILALDSDYDFIAAGHTPCSIMLNEHEFIFQTYCYALENFQAEPSQIPIIITQVAKQSITSGISDGMSFNEVFDRLGELISDVLFRLIYLKKRKVDAQQHLDSLLKVTSLQGVNGNFEQYFAEVNLQLTSLNSFLTIHNEKFDHNYQLWCEETLSVIDKKWYLAYRGHDLLDNVIKPLVKHYTHKRMTYRFNQLKGSSGDYQQKIRQYRLAKKPSVYLIENRTDFDKTCVYAKIVTDLSKFLKLHH